MATHSIAEIAELVRNGMPPSDVAGLVLKAVRNNELYIFTHADMLAPLEARPIASSVPHQRKCVNGKGMNCKV